MKRRVSKVSDIISQKTAPVQMIRSDESIGTLSRRLQKERIGAVVVSDDDGETIAGIISERDIAYGLSLHRSNLHELPVSALMTKKVVTCSLNTKLYDVVRMMGEFHIRHVPVVHNKKVVAILGMRDVIEQRLEELQGNLHLMGKLVMAS
jgi:CBS domain-containing protein